jgi:F0F1-type ATP synthase membrane subunit b/b'
MTTHPILLALAQVAPQSAEPQLLDVDATAFVMFGLFLLTVLVLTVWLWKPYLRVREERVSRVDGFREEAERLDKQATERLARVEAQLGEARRVGSAERTRSRTEAQAVEARLGAEAQASAQKALAAARAQVEAALTAERARLQERATTLGRDITSKVLGRPVAS